MGTINHNAIVVTSWDPKLIRRARREAGRIFPWVSPVSPQVVNGYSSFFIPPDGSKEGWVASNEGDSRRAEFIKWMNAQAYDCGSSALEWIDVGFGEYGYEVEANNHEHYLEKQAALRQEKEDPEGLSEHGRELLS